MAWRDVCKVFRHERTWFGLSSAIICWGESGKQSGNLAPARTHCTVMITFIVPIDFLMTLWLVIFTSNLPEKKLAVHLKVMISALSFTLGIYYSFFPVLSSFTLLFPPSSHSPPPRAHIHKQMGISKKLKSHFWHQFNPFLFSFSPQSFWHRNGQFMTAKLSEHTSAHIYPWQFLLTRWEVFFASCLMWYRYFLSPDKCTVISLQTKYSGMTILWKREWGKAMWKGGKKGQSLHSQGNACEYLLRHFSKAFCLSCVK